jgi:hypothetical protein
MAIASKTVSAVSQPPEGGSAGHRVVMSPPSRARAGLDQREQLGALGERTSSLRR